MLFIDWVLVLGAVALVAVLAAPYLRHLPLSETLIYLLVGVTLASLGWLKLDLPAQAHWLERVTEVVVIVSLFVGGLKLRLHPTHSAWKAAFRLAIPMMLLCILAIALLGYFALGLSLATALLLGAILAPTDPVLADEFAVADSQDHDRLRYGLSGEAGLNDGMAFPLVVLGLLMVEYQGQWGDWLGGWALSELLWAVPSGLALGFGIGFAVGGLLFWVRQKTADSSVSSTLLLVALVGLSYGLAETIHAWGFLSVFAAGVGLRQAEVSVSRGTETVPELQPSSSTSNSPAETLLEPLVSDSDLEHPRVASGVVIRETLVFGEALERLFVLGAVLLVGAFLVTSWDWRGVVLGLVLFFVIRPLAVFLSLWRTPTTLVQRALMGWFGIRGIGSLYYLSYAIGEGIGPERAAELSNLTITVVGLSIAMHGLSATPLLHRYQRYLRRTPSATPQPTLSPSVQD